MNNHSMQVCRPNNSRPRIRCAVVLLLLTACNSSGTTATDANPQIADANPSTRDGGPGSTDAGDPNQPTIATCYHACNTSGDCAQKNDLFDGNNYDCVAGTCRWTGCKSTTECQATYQSSSYACDSQSQPPTCLPTCTNLSDCAIANALYDDDNYACDAGVCRWRGCKSTAECIEAYDDENYDCKSLPGLGVPVCVQTCGTADDCTLGSAVYDNDNYACNDGLCVWTGCNSNDECAATFMDEEYVCR